MASRAPQDNAYKGIFSHPAMVRDLLRGFVREDWVGELDFETLEKVSGNHLSEDLRGRESDLIWRLRLRGRWLYVYLLLEFQSTDDPWMALRVMVYTGLLYQELIRTKVVGRRDRLPPVFPIVIYNGRPRWRAARDVAELIAPLPPGLQDYRPSQRFFLLDEGRTSAADRSQTDNAVAMLIRIENNAGHERLRELVGGLARQLSAPEHESLRRAMTAWLNQVVVSRAAPGDNPPQYQDLQEVETMLEETVDGWVRKWKRQGLEEGRREGRQEGRQEGLVKGRVELLERQLIRRFNAPLPSWVRPQLESAGIEQLDRWAEDLFDAQSLETLLKSE